MLIAPSAKTMSIQKTQLTSIKGQKPLLAGDGCLPHNEKKDIYRSKPKEIMEAMAKLDAKLIAYLAGNDKNPVSKNLTYDTIGKKCSIDLMINIGKDKNCPSDFHTQQLLKNISDIKLHLEALTLQAEGTKIMDLICNDIRPIFTVECQLSYNLIKNVQRHDMFHIIQFESEKFQSLTQCARFGQEDKRKINFEIEKEWNNKYNYGNISFTVWWREPGTCLNEMLGIGNFELSELLEASLIEKCKCIHINRRGRHLASLYLKISFLFRHPVASKLFAMAPEQSVRQYNNNDNSDEENIENKNKPLSNQSLLETDSKETSDSIGAGSAPHTNNADDSLVIKSSDISMETLKVRLLKGFIYACETRKLEMLGNCDYDLICRRFWFEDAGIVTIGNGNKFNYQEQFSVINDDQFLKCVNMQRLQLEIWRRYKTDQDSNGNSSISNTQIIGTVHLPLHQFFIAYRDATITNHLCKSKMPVISVDSWTPIICYHTKANIGELKCLLAIGSEDQIINLKELRFFENVAIKSVDNKYYTKPCADYICQNTSKKYFSPSSNSEINTKNVAVQNKISNNFARNTLVESQKVHLACDNKNNAKQHQQAANSSLIHVDTVIDEFEQSLGLNHMNLGYTIKRKFNELEQISQRLRTRLTNVTGQQISQSFDSSILDNWESLEVSYELDIELDEFEHDISHQAISEDIVNETHSISNTADKDNNKGC